MHPMAPTCSCTARMPSNFFHLKNMNFRFLVETMRTLDGVVGTIRSCRLRKKLYTSHVPWMAKYQVLAAAISKP